MKWHVPPYDYNKLGKNVVAAVLMPAATVFSTTGEWDKAQHAALLGVGAAVLIILGFVQSPYKRGTFIAASSLDPAPSSTAEETKTNE